MARVAFGAPLGPLPAFREISMSRWKDKVEIAARQLVSAVRKRWEWGVRRDLPLQMLYERAAAESADLIQENLETAVLFDRRLDYLKWVISQIPEKGLIMEAGVRHGESINLFAACLAARGDRRPLHGFDAFEGLEENWTGMALPAGSLTRQGRLPKVHDNVRLHKGWVQETVGPFLERHPGEPLAFLHIDTDTYLPARHLLDATKPRFQRGTVIAFDELIGYPNWKAHEYRALTEVLARESYEFIAFTGRQAAIRIR